MVLRSIVVSDLYAWIWGMVSEEMLFGAGLTQVSADPMHPSTDWQPRFAVVQNKIATLLVHRTHGLRKSTADFPFCGPSFDVTKPWAAPEI